ncbi:MAG: RidA family protein [Alphaproteobacteria bacterium]|nr:RidA family protein [Alphaproteobacteria bacterium]
MKLVVHDPHEGIYRSTDDYVHAIEVQRPERFLFVSGTMGLDAMGVPGPHLDAQLQLLWSNIRAILRSANMTVDNIVRVTSYLRDGAYADKNARARVEALNGRTVPTTAIIVQTLEANWLVELEVVAAA